ncbi:MAG: hypothetical protein SFW36_06900 [Leptolyngbyaceae cyanobacterium bins.59]|nr:hypothetical protein [Leptolyngbyaceae cyanobacterium bins.59]
MLHQFKILLILVAFCFTSLACADSPNSEARADRLNPQSQVERIRQLPNGSYPVQQATYDDAGGQYTLTLLNTPQGVPSTLQTTDLPMARLTDEEVKSGQTSYLKVENNQPSLHLASDFKIEYVHNVTETQQNPETGRPETVVVRQESSFWTPFAAAIAGQAVASWLFTPRYYMPPIYQPGVALVGYGGYGQNYNQAVNRYRTRYNAPPLETRHRAEVRTTGRLRTATNRTGGGPFNRSQDRTRTRSGNRSTGSGYGTSTLRRSRSNTPTRTNRPSGFGSGRSRGVTRSGRRR